ncbi:MAG: C40 family peptidase [Flavobacterium sp.]|nr:C40 family peptidase [Flavobacterium sp.]
MLNKISSFILIIFLSLSFSVSAQTASKETSKRSTYQKPAKNTKNTSAQNKKASSAMANIKALLNDREPGDLEFSASENYVAVQMINNAMTFIGVKYRGGGTSMAGMDCSGMVTAVFNLFDKQLPRSSHEMAKVGQKVSREQAQKGDLVFFKTNGRSSINHVGMVVDVTEDEIKFVHSSTSRGVIVSSTKEPYYNRAFAQINRVL